MTQAIIKPPRLNTAIFPGNGELFEDLVEQVDDCAEARDGCHRCPYIRICVAWWDLHVCEYLATYRLRQEKFVTLTLRFAKIRVGRNGNGHKKEF